MNWKNESRINKFAEKIETSVKFFEDAVYDAIEKTQAIDEYLVELTTCPLNKDQLSARLTNIQKVLDELNFNDFSNLS